MSCVKIHANPSKRCLPKSRACPPRGGCRKNPIFGVEKNRIKCPIKIQALNGVTDQSEDRAIIGQLESNGQVCLDCGGNVKFLSDDLIDVSVNKESPKVEISGQPTIDALDECPSNV